MRKTKVKIIFFIFLFFSTSLFSQVTSLEFERISIDQGLSNNSINSILQTGDGFLWIATKDGLNRFDGKTFKVFKHVFSDTTSLPQNYVMSLYEDREKQLWVGTWGGGLCMYNSKYENFTSFDFPNKNDDYVQCLFEDNSKNIWIGTLTGGMNKLSADRKVLTNFSTLPNADIYFPSDNITYITQLGDFLWIGTWEKGLFQYNLKTNLFEQYLFDIEKKNDANSTLIWDIHKKTNGIYLLSTNSGIIEFNIENKSYTKYFNDLTFRKIITDSRGRIWAGTYSYNGIYLFTGKNNIYSEKIILQYSDDDSFTLTNNRIRWIYEDNLNNIWVGTEDGLNKLPETKNFFQYKYFPLRNSSIGGRVVSSIFEGKNNLWVGYGGGGFNSFDLNNNQIKHFVNNPNKQNSPSSNDVVILYEDKKSNLWIGTSNAGLNRYNPHLNKFDHYLVNPLDSFSIKSNWVHQIIELEDDFFLIGTNESLELFDSKRERFSRFKPELNSKLNLLPELISVNALYKDSRNNIWIGTWLDGLYMYDPKSKLINHYLPEKVNSSSISSNKVISIFEDSQKNIWIGTHSGGLNKMDVEKGIFFHYTTQNGLPNDVVFGMLEDENGFLWISTMKGLVKFNPLTEHFRIYDKLDGLINNQLNWHAYFQNRNGKMYFGGINGFVSFYPNSISVDSVAMPAKFISFKVNNKEIRNMELLSQNEIIELEYYENFFSIEFLVLDFIPSIKHNYLYKLNGLDNEWIKSEPSNVASYTDIKPGEYRFVVKASNADGIWSEETNLSIVINPAWWMTWWFRVLQIFIISAIGFSIYKYRVNQLLKIERIRLNISRDLHDEIGSSLSSICVESQVLMENDQIKPKEREQLSIIKKTSLDTMQAMRDIIWFINPENEWSEDIVLKMKETAANSLLEIDWSFNCTKEINLSGLNLEAKRNIFLIYKEILTNVCIHSKATNCKIEIITLPKTFKMIIIDNGIGFDYKTLKRRSGLINIQKRAEQIGGKTEIISVIGSGTKIEFMAKK
ncbi:MAG: hypothetical protein KKF62_05615 [Bacteroidetes bacterium]|nr:hypothetical protein [Bacteroidota bacterium]MBU1116815.1 hypothetical protein [Bacteroidota bacterium]MBU1799422.1 hypothetical protein [Bacteroidota bacterium]